MSGPILIVDENSLAQSISVLRRALEEKPGDNNYIVTLPGRGYQFVVPVAVVAPDTTTISPEAAAGPSHPPRRTAHSAADDPHQCDYGRETTAEIARPATSGGDETGCDLSYSCGSGCWTLRVEAVSADPAAGKLSGCFDGLDSPAAPFHRSSRIS